MSDVEIALSREEYKILLRFLFFADYCVSSGFNSDFIETYDKEKLFEILEKLYTLGDSIGCPKSTCLNSLTSSVRFSQDEVLKQQKQVERDLERIAYAILAQEFALRELHLPKKDHLFDFEGGWMIKDELIRQRMKPYIREFQENGLSNLRLKLFHSLPTEENDI